MQRTRSAVIGSLIALVALAAFAGAGHAATYPQDHDGWSIGFGIGGGSAGISDNSGNSSTRETSGMGSFRLGYPMNKQLSLALESNAWTKSENGATVTFDATTAGVAFFPSEGWVLRGGLGLGRATVSASSGNLTLTSTESGFGLTGGVGYEFRLARTFALGPQIDGGYTSFSGGSANWFGAGLEFNWYFLKK